jgi:hypothetical protein
LPVVVVEFEVVVVVVVVVVVADGSGGGDGNRGERGDTPPAPSSDDGEAEGEWARGELFALCPADLPSVFSSRLRGDVEWLLLLLLLLLLLCSLGDGVSFGAGVEHVSEADWPALASLVSGTGDTIPPLFSFSEVPSPSADDDDECCGSSLPAVRRLARMDAGIAIVTTSSISSGWVVVCGLGCSDGARWLWLAEGEA